MKKDDKKAPGRRVWLHILGVFFFWGLFLTTAGAAAEAPGKKGVEMTPGPRMIRAVEALANDTLAARDLLKLSPEQEGQIRREVVAFKKDLWRKEAVLIGMFEEISLKRRHGLLSREEYRNANTLTGGIESDELGRLIKGVTALQEVLTPEQKEAFRAIRKPQMNLEMPEGFNTRLGLMAVGRWGKVYGEYREALGLSEAQTVSLRNGLEEARREIIRIGTDIEISRMEAYDLLKEPVIDPKKTQEAMERTAHLEGIFFPKLSEVSRKLEGILTQPQRVKLEEIRKENPKSGSASAMGRSAYSNIPGNGSAAGESVESISLLDLAEELVFSRPQIEKLAVLETTALRHERLDQAELQIQKLELEEGIRQGASEKEIEEQINRISQLVADIERDRLQTRVAGLKILDEKQKVALRVSFVE